MRPNQWTLKKFWNYLTYGWRPFFLFVIRVSRTNKDEDLKFYWKGFKFEVFYDPEKDEMIVAVVNKEGKTRSLMIEQYR